MSPIYLTLVLRPRVLSPAAVRARERRGPPNERVEFLPATDLPDDEPLDGVYRAEPADTACPHCRAPHSEG